MEFGPEVLKKMLANQPKSALNNFDTLEQLPESTKISETFNGLL